MKEFQLKNSVISFTKILKKNTVITDICPNHKGCQIINIEGFVSEPSQRIEFIKTYCEAENNNWSQCKRFQTKDALNFCPDFVMPNSAFSLDEILDKMENEY